MADGPSSKKGSVDEEKEIISDITDATAGGSDDKPMLGAEQHLNVRVVSVSADSGSENDDDDDAPAPPAPPSPVDIEELAPPSEDNAKKDETPPAPAPPEPPTDVDVQEDPLSDDNAAPSNIQVAAARSGSGGAHIAIPIPQASPSSASPSESPPAPMYDVHSAVMDQTQIAHNRRKHSVADQCDCPIYVYCAAFFFLLPLEPVTYPLNLLWIHVFPALIEKEDLFDTVLDQFKLLLQHLSRFILWPLSTPVFKGGCCKNKDTIKKFGVAYIIFVILACVLLVVWVVVAVVVAIAVIIAAICLYIVLGLLVALFAVLCFLSAATHSIVFKVWSEVVVKILPFFDHPIVMDLDNDLVIRQIEYDNENKLFVVLGLLGAVFFFPFTVLSSVLFGLQKTTKHLLRISFVVIAFPIFLSTAMWVTGLIFLFMYYNATEQYHLRELSSVKEVTTSQIFGVSSIILFFTLIISSLCVYRKHCIGAQVTSFPTYILLIPGWILLGPIMVLAVPFWGDRMLSISWLLWNMIWFRPKRKMSGIDFGADRIRSYSKTIKAKNKKKQSSANVLSHLEDVTPKRRAVMMVSWVVLGIPTFLVYPVAFICEPLPNIPYNKIIVPFCNSLLFWICSAVSTYLWSKPSVALSAYWILFAGIAGLSFIILAICCADIDNFKYISSARKQRHNKSNACCMFAWVFCANLLSFPAGLFGLVWPAWPMTVMQNYNVDAEIATKNAQKSEATSPAFWEPLTSPIGNCGRIMSCVMCILAIPVFVVWVVSYGGYNIMRYEGHYYVVTYLCSLLICGSFIDYWFEFWFPQLSFVILVVNGLFAFLLSYFFCNVKESAVKIGVQFVQNFLTIIYFCVIFTFGLYGASISFLSFIYHGLRSFCGLEDHTTVITPAEEENRASRRSYVE